MSDSYERDVAAVVARDAAWLRANAELEKRVAPLRTPPGASTSPPLPSWFAAEIFEIVGRLVSDAVWGRRVAVLEGLVRLGAVAKVAHDHALAHFDAQTGRD